MTQSHQRDIRLEAATWHARLASDDASTEDFLGFEAWVADPACRAAFDEIQSAMFDIEDHSDALRDALSGPGGVRVGTAWPRPGGSGRWKSKGVIGGSVAALATLAAAFFVSVMLPSTTSPVAGVVYAAEPNATRLVTLADNTEITLNRGAEVTVYWEKAERRVVLANGEATFKVQHNKDRPFSVLAGTDRIRDIGTVFNVLKDGDRLTVTVAEGEISVISGTRREQRVRADFQYSVDHASDSAEMQPVRPEDAMAWQQGRLVYRDAALAAIVRDMNRYSDQPIHIEDPAVGELRFSGALRIDRADAMLNTLEKFLPIDVKEIDGTFVVESRK